MTGSQIRVRRTYAQGDDKAHERAPKLENSGAESGGVGRDHVKRHGGHGHQHGAENDQAPVGSHGAQDLAGGRMLGPRQKIVGFPPASGGYMKRNGDDARSPPTAECASRRRTSAAQKKRSVQPHAEQGGKDHGALLAGRLPAHVKTFVAGGGDLGKIDGNAAQLDARGEALHQPPDHHQQGRPACRWRRSRACRRSKPCPPTSGPA